jgi:ribokinase
VKIFVVGSLNADLVQRVERFPKSGETLVGSDLNIVSGGKGSNQAFAAAYLGGKTTMIGRIGTDPFGPTLLQSLATAGVDTSRIQKSDCATGTATILVATSGDNTIVISPGANARLTPEDVADHLRDLDEESILLTQLEVPIETTAAAVELAHQRGAVTILDPAPARELPRKLLQQITFLTPNQTEAALLLGASHEANTFSEARDVARRLLDLDIPNIVLKLGALGVLLASESGFEEVAGFAVKPIDSTAAGDTWNGAFAVALAEQKSRSDAARFANAAAAISVTRAGAQSAIPQRREVDAFLASQ